MFCSGHAAPASLRISLLVALTAAASGGVWAEEPSRGKGGATAIEEARRELKELPASQRADPGRERGLDVSLPVPVLTPSGTRGSGSRSASNPATGSTSTQTGPSQGWLLDALQARQLEKSGRGYSTRTPQDRETEAADAQRKTRESPLNAYLQTWLTDRDRALLAPKETRPTDFEPSGVADLWRQNAQSGELMGRRNTTPKSMPTDKRAVNPYLENSTTASAFGAEALTPATPPTRALSGEPSLPTVALPTTASPRSLDASLPVAQPQAAPTAPLPTAPLVDERRYFPQLKRF